MIKDITNAIKPFIRKGQHKAAEDAIKEAIYEKKTPIADKRLAFDIANEITDKYCFDFRVSVDSIRSNDRNHNLVYHRYMLSNKILREGVPAKIVGKVLNRDRTTILYYRDRYVNYTEKI